MTIKSRLSNLQIVILRSLVKRGASSTPISLSKWQRRSSIALWRRGLIDIWFRQLPSECPSPRGPFYTLTIIGARLAFDFIYPAPRGLSGAEQKP